MSEDFGHWIYCKSCERMVSMKRPCEHFVPLDEGTLEQHSGEQQRQNSEV